MTKTNKLKIISDVEGVGEITHEETLTVNTQTTVSIEFNFNSNTDKGSLVTKIGTKDKTTETSTKPKVYQNADLYMSNVWSDSAAAYVTVKDLSVISTNPTSKISQCLKIAKKVAFFSIASEASYVYILSGQKFKNGKFLRVFENPCGQTVLPDRSLLKQLTPSSPRR